MTRRIRLHPIPACDRPRGSPKLPDAVEVSEASGECEAHYRGWPGRHLYPSLAELAQAHACTPVEVLGRELERALAGLRTLAAECGDLPTVELVNAALEGDGECRQLAAEMAVSAIDNEVDPCP